MQFLIYGAGAVGSLIGARLSDRHRVTLLARALHVEAIRKHGLRLAEKDGETHSLPLHAIDDVSQLEAVPDYVLVAVKASATEPVAPEMARFQSSYVVSLQNGLGNEETLARHHDRVIAAVINQGAVHVGPGEIRHAGGETTLFGAHSPVPGEAIDRLTDAFNESGVPARRVDNIQDELWRKAIINAAVNPLSALTRKRSGELLDDGPMERTIAAILTESVAIAEACGASVEVQSLAATVRRILQLTQTNKTSMLQDIERGRITEIEAMNGALVKRAREKGIPAPVNQLMADLIRALAPET